VVAVVAVGVVEVAVEVELRLMTGPEEDLMTVVLLVLSAVYFEVGFNSRVLSIGTSLV
jgi:hypothetical protein